MRAEVLPYLRCPVCSGQLTAADRTIRCERGHAFDVARQGYAHLNSGPLRHPGDTAEMIAARVDFLAGGHYAFIADALAEAAGQVGRGAGDGLVVDVGAGSGYYLAAVLDARPGAVGLALDSSKAAARRAARAHPRASAAVCDAWGRLPLADGSAALLLDVFAPRNAPEFRRVLAAGGVLLVVVPEPEHLAELVGELGLLRVDPEKADRLAAELGPPVAQRRLSRVLRLRHDELRALIGMGPSAWHIDRQRAQRSDDLWVAAWRRTRRARVVEGARDQAPQIPEHSHPDDVDRLPEPFPVTAAVRINTYRLSG